MAERGRIKEGGPKEVGKRGRDERGGKKEGGPKEVGKKREGRKR